MSDRVYQLRIFIQIAELGSFVGAARVLKIPPATVSAAIRMLEAELGVRLLHRTTRQVGLTHDGERVLPMARKIAGDLEAMYRLVEDEGHVVSGRLSVDVPSRIASRLMAPQLPSLLERHPELELTVGSCDRYIDMARDGIDCVIRVGDPRDDGLVRRPLGSLEMVNCASPRYLAANDAPTHPDDLARHWVVGYAPSPDEHPGLWRCPDAAGGARQMPLRYRIAVNNVDSYLACCLAGVGLVQVPRFDVRHLLASGELVEVLHDWPAAPMPVSALYLHRNQRSPRLAAFIDWFQPLLDRAVA